MKTFDIYEHSTVTSQVIAVKKGWSWLAFFFAPIYSLIKKNWICFFIWLALSIVTIIVASFVNAESAIVLRIFALIWYWGVPIFIGLKFNAFLGDSLVKRGFVLKETIMSNSAELATMEYIQKRNKEKL